MKESNFPKFSVIIPTYNRAHVILRAVNSVLNQTFKDFELIIVDDGSKDKTDLIISEINDDRIVFSKHEVNKGQNAALNTGISIAKGEFISFLDSDDEWLPTMLEKQFSKYSQNEGYDCVYTRPGIFLKDGTILPGRKYFLEGYIYKEALEQGYITSPSTLSVKRKCIIEVGGFNFKNKFSQDDMICLKLAKKYKFGLVPEVLGIIHFDAGNQLISNVENKANDTLDLIRTYEDDIIKICGKSVLAKHLAKVGKLNFEASRRKNSKELYKEVLKLDFNFKYLFYYILSFFPSILYRFLKNFKFILIRIVNKIPDSLLVLKKYNLVKALIIIFRLLKINEKIYFPGIKYPIFIRRNTSDFKAFRHVFLRCDYSFPIGFNPKYIIDGGANVGYASIYFANRFPNAKIISVEPEKSNYEVLVKNTSKYKNIITINSAIWSDNTFLRIKDKNVEKWEMMVEECLEDTNGSFRAISIEEIMKIGSYEQIDILKLDIEGSEKEIFEKNYETWLNSVKLIIIELHDEMKPGCSESFNLAVSKYNFERMQIEENVILKKYDRRN